MLESGEEAVTDAAMYIEKCKVCVCVGGVTWGVSVGGTWGASKGVPGGPVGGGGGGPGGGGGGEHLGCQWFVCLVVKVCPKEAPTNNHKLITTSFNYSHLSMFL